MLEVAGVLDLTGHLLKGIHIAASDEYTTNGTVRMNWPLTTVWGGLSHLFVDAPFNKTK